MPHLDQSRRPGTLPVAAVESVLAGSAVVRIARRTGILGEVTGEDARSASDVAAARGLDPRATRVALDALVELGLIERCETGYRGHPGLPELVDRMGGALDGLEARLRSGRPTLSGDRPDEAGALYRGLAGMLGRLFGDVAREAAELLAEPGLRILDVGAGAAPWSRAIVAREPSCRVEALDLPEVLPSTRRAVPGDGLEDRFGFVEADALEDPLPGDFDLVLAANLCHLFDADTAARLIHRLARAARPGGRVAIIDAVPDHDDPERRRYAALYAAGLLTRTASGGIHAFDRYRAWLREAGCRAVDRFDCQRFPTTVIRGARAEDWAHG